MGSADWGLSSRPRGGPLPRMGAQRGVSPPSGFPEWEEKPGDSPPRLRGSPNALSGEGSLESLLLASGFPRARVGAQPSTLPHAARVPPFGYGVPQVRKWERSLKSLFTAGGEGFPRPRGGAQRRPSSRLGESHSPKRSPAWGPSSTLRGSYGSDGNRERGSCLHTDGFLRPGVGSQSEAPPPACGVPVAPSGNAPWDPLLVCGW